MTPGGPGESWKRRREALGKSVEDVSIDLHVSAKFIRGIEEGDFKGFPVRVFSAGFIRAYAKYLSEDPEPVLSQYYRQLEARAEGEQKPAVKPEWLEREKQRGSRRAAYVSAAGVVLALGIVVAWLSIRSVPAPPPPPASDAPLPSLDNAVAAPPTAVADNAAASPGTEPEKAAAAGPAPERGPWHLEVEAIEQTWFLYKRDDATPVDVILSPGDRMTIRAEKKLRVRVGNAGGITATLNGRPLPAFGPRGAVREFRLGD